MMMKTLPQKNKFDFQIFFLAYLRQVFFAKNIENLLAELVSPNYLLNQYIMNDLYFIPSYISIYCEGPGWLNELGSWIT
jgi:hypothetical protein